MRTRRMLVLALAAPAGFALAGFSALAASKTYTLADATNAQVTNQHGATKHEAIVVNSRAFAVYTLSGETTHKLLCTVSNGCLSFWKPVTVASTKHLSEGPGVRGKVGVFKRGKTMQVTLAGHPLYTFVSDRHARAATGEGIRSFGGTWHVVAAVAGHTKTTTTTTKSTSTMPCLYPPYC